MNIIHLVLGKANPERMNGINKVVDSLAREQAILGQAVSVWGITPSPTAETSKRIYGLRLFQALKNKLALDNGLKAAIAGQDVDSIFHLHGGFIPEYYQVAALLQKRNIPYIISPHGNYATNALLKNRIVKKIYFALFEKRLLKNCKAIHCLGDGESKDIAKICDGKKNVIVPNGQYLHEIPVKSHTNEIGIPFFGFCGRLSRSQKGLDLLMEGFRIYKNEKGNKGKLCIIGSGEYMATMQKFAYENALVDDIEFCGPLYGIEKYNKIQLLDAFYHPSRNEGLPTAVLEAAACSVACVVSEQTNMGNQIEECSAGILLEHNNAEHIALSMVKIKDWKEDGVLQIKSANARAMVETHFQWGKIAQSLIDIYKKK